MEDAEILPFSRKMKGKSLSFFTFFCTFISFSMVLRSSTASDTLTPNQSLIDGMTLVSTGQSFELGFFSPGDSESRYLGVRYKNFPNTVVWVANKEKPITDRHGVLSIDTDANLISSLTKNKECYLVISFFKISRESQLLDSGNFVLRDTSEVNPEVHVWQSFDFPCDTQLPGMKLGWDLKTGHDWYLTSWKNASDPFPGDFACRIDMAGLPQVVLRKESEKKYHTGPWNGAILVVLP